MLPTAAMVRDAARRLQGVAQKTPLVRSDALTRHLGVDVYLKCENLQHTGSFKLRGAYNALASLSDAQRAGGVVASSAGNHGMGVAYAARALGVRARVFIPANAPAVKRDGIVALGAEVNQEQPHYDAAHDAALHHAADTGAEFVNPCAGMALLAGQGTVAIEILDELPQLAAIVVPVGGGGLVGGIAGFLREAGAGVRIVGAQSDQTDAMARSLRAGKRVDVSVPPTLCDGLAGQIDDEGFAIGRLAIDDLCVVTEADVADAIAFLAREEGTKVEGSGAVGVAAVRSMPPGFLPGPVVVVVSGGNIDDERWRMLTARAQLPPTAP